MPGQPPLLEGWGIRLANPGLLAPLTALTAVDKADIGFWTGTPDVFLSNRLTSVWQLLSANTPAVNPDVLAVAMSFLRPSNANAVSTDTFGIVFFTPAAYANLDVSDFESTLNHEVRHVEMGLALKGANYPGKNDEQTTLGALERDLYLEVYKAGVGQLKYMKAAGEIVVDLEHLELEYKLIKAFFDTSNQRDQLASHWNLRSSSISFGKEYMILMNALRNGVPIKGAANVSIVNPSVRNGIIGMLRKFHTEIPEQASMIRIIEEKETPVNVPGPEMFGPPLRIPMKEN